MASLCRDKSRGANGRTSFRILFVNGAGARQVLYLGACTVKVAEHWLRRVEALIANQTSGVAHDAELSKWLHDLPDISYDKLFKAGLAPERASKPGVTLEELTEAFTSRATVKPITVLAYRQTLDSLLAFYGRQKRISTITAASADEWKAAIASDVKGGRKKRTTSDNRLSPPTVAKRVAVAKQLFRRAVRWGWLEQSPFDGLRLGSQVNPARSFYVDQRTIAAVLDACPSAEWRAIVGLSRYAGLRCPSEVGALTWADVNWEKGRLTVRSSKTEHHGGDHAVRVVPMSPALRVILGQAFEQAAPGETLVAPHAQRGSVNLRTRLEKIIERAGHAAWPRLFQNLRASCATDWVERYPAHVVAKWLGHSPKVAATHYLQAREHHFDDVVTGGRGGLEADPSCSADCSAPTAQIAAQHVPAGSGREPHQKTEPAATTRVTAGFARITPVSKTGPMGSTGLEPVTSTV